MNTRIFKTAMMLTAALAMTASVLFTACKKDEPSSGGGTGNTGSVDVYVAGYNNNEKGIPIAIVWKNGVATTLSNTTSFANSVFVSGSDVYVAGFEGLGYKAKLWKNGVATDLTDGSNYMSGANSVFVSGNDVYVAGWDGDYAVLWKNGVEQKLSDNTSRANRALSVFVSGSDVYVGGNQNKKAALWKNGVLTTLSDGIGGNASDGTPFNDEATSVLVSGNDVYVAITENVDFYNTRAVIWKNGEKTQLSKESASFPEANSVYISGNDVYVAGGEGTSAILWKNGVPQKLEDYDNGSFAFSVFVSGSDVYVSGEARQAYPGPWAASLWKNGEIQYLTNPTISGTRDIAYSVFVVKK